eukprot:4535243-Alexandrium_andersonii.AAC.1
MLRIPGPRGQGRVPPVRPGAPRYTSPRARTRALAVPQMQVAQQPPGQRLPVRGRQVGHRPAPVRVDGGREALQ